MPELLGAYYSQVGHEDARFYDLSLVFTDPETGDVSPATVLLLGNGKGKTSLIQLLFSIFEPNINKFLGKTSQGGDRKFDLYFARGEVGYIMTRWRIGGTDRTRIVGQCVEIKRHTEERIRYFFTFVESEDFTIDHMPIRQNSKPGREITTARGFAGYFREKCSRDDFITDVQEEWVNALRNRGFEPILFDLMLKMNQQEGSANEMLSFVGSWEKFVDLVIAAVITRKEAEPILGSMRSQKETLSSENDLRAERSFLQAVRQPIGEIVGPAEERKALEIENTRVQGEVMGCIGKTKALSRRIEQDLHVLEKEGAEAEQEVSISVERLDNHQKELRWLERTSLEVQVQHLEGLVAAEEKAALQLDREHAALEAVESLLDEQEHTIEMEAAYKEVEAAEAPHKETKEKLGRAADLYYEAAFREERRLSDAVVAAREALREAERTLEGLYEKRAALSGQEGVKRKEREALQEWLRKASGERKLLEREGYLQPDINALQAYGYLKSRHDETANVVAQKETEAEDLAGQALDLAALLRSLGEKKARLTAERQQVEKKLSDYTADRATIEEDLAHVDESLDVNLPGRLEERIGRLEELRQTEIIKSEEDRNDLRALQNDGLLPPSRDAIKVVNFLLSGNIPATTHAESLYKNERGDEASISSKMREDPGRYAGVIISASSDMEKASQLLRGIKGLRSPVQVTALGKEHRPLQGKDGTEYAVALPDSATYNREAASYLVQRLTEDLGKIDRDIRELEKDTGRLRNLKTRAEAFYMNYPYEWEEIRRHEKHTLDVKLSRVTNETTRHEEQYRVVNRRTAEIKQEVTGLRKELENCRVGLVKVDKFVNDYESHIDIQSLALKRAEELLAHLDNDITTTVAETSKTRKTRDEKAETLSWRVDEHKKAVNRRDRITHRTGNEAILPPTYTFEELEKDYLALGKALEEKTGVLAGANEKFDIHSKESDKARGKLNQFPEDVRQRASEIKQQLLEFETIQTARPLVARERGDVSLQQKDARETLGARRGELDRTNRELEKFRKKYPDAAKPEGIAVGRAEIKGGIIAWEKKVEDDKTAVEHAKSRHAGITAAIATKSNEKNRLNRHMMEMRKNVEDYDAVEDSHEPYENIETAEAEWDKLDAEQRRLAKEIEHVEAMFQHCRDRINRILADADYGKCPQEVRVNFQKSLDSIRLEPRRYLKEIDEKIAPISYALDSIEKNKEKIIDGLYELYHRVERALDRIEKDSEVPESSSSWAIWGGKRFIKIDITSRVRKEDGAKTLLNGFVGNVMSETERIPGDAMKLLEAAVRAVLRNNITVSLLKPESTPRLAHIPIERFSSFSGGEKMTTAILLFMAFGKLLSVNRQSLFRDMNPLIVDNPLGTSSSGNFIELQRTIARSCRTQLIYATAVNDHQALSQFNLIIKMEKNREDERGRRYVGVIETIPGKELKYDTAVLRIGEP
ncbi:MAG: Chromosome partition protein Smc [Syntrophorhabdus sp. PtaU1.Bin050]|nr:MAG: Chromosome partition protein Smc [Syntrophorhabdus sp. PtaU1.Bin050]